MRRRPWVVVIDDTLDTRTLAVAFLQMEFETIHVFSCHPEDYRDQPWESIATAIIDLRMDPPGAEVLAWLAEHHPDVRRVAWSAYATDADAHAVIQKPALDHLRTIVAESTIDK